MPLVMIIFCFYVRNYFWCMENSLQPSQVYSMYALKYNHIHFSWNSIRLVLVFVFFLLFFPLVLIFLKMKLFSMFWSTNHGGLMLIKKWRPWRGKVIRIRTLIQLVRIYVYIYKSTCCLNDNCCDAMFSFRLLFLREKGTVLTLQLLVLTILCKGVFCYFCPPVNNRFSEGQLYTEMLRHLCV